MHELGITRSVVAICVEHARGARVKRVRLEIGRLTAILPDSVRFCFDVCTKGTVVEGARLEIIETPGLAICCECGAEVALTQPFGRCRCGCNHLRQVAGTELKVKEMETE
jgi:hydrogenase nickel incorporation protein HypA/HybF